MSHRRLRTRRFSICNFEILLNEPLDPEEVLADAVAGHLIDPYWGKIWDSAPAAAAAILKSNIAKGTQTLELGCGCGLLGIAAMIAGLDVTFSDHEAEAVQLAMENAKLNGLENVKGIVLDWNQPVDATYELLIASDVLYEQQFHQPLLDAAGRMLGGAGQFLIGDPGRTAVKEFLQTAMDIGWTVEIFGSDQKPKLVPTINQFQWLVLRK